MRKSIVILTVLFVGSFVSAEILVPEGFVVDHLLQDCQGNVYQIDGQTPRLEAIKNPEYGFGVISASIDDESGVLTVLKISHASIEVLGTMSGFPTTPSTEVGDVRFDTTGLFSNHLYLCTWMPKDSGNDPVHTKIFRVLPDGNFIEEASKGSTSDKILFRLDFTNGAGGYTPGAYLYDYYGTHGTSLYHMDSNFYLTPLAQDSNPSGRNDTDVFGMEFDSTGLYSMYWTLADSEDISHALTTIYQIKPDLSWEPLTTSLDRTERNIRDMTFSNGGSFEQMLYVTDRANEKIMTVDPNGNYTDFASGFSMIESISVSEDNEHMYVSDENGIYRIRSITTIIGPTLIMQEPKVEADGVHTNPSGIDDLRVQFSERVLFSNSDVSIIDANDISVPFSVSGSNSQFMIIAFGETLINDKYTITIHDSVVSADTGNPIDGDEDGLAGGNAVIVMEHRQRHDSDNDNDIDLVDLSAFAIKWLWVD